jgi:hypothetical protein
MGIFNPNEANRAIDAASAPQVGDKKAKQKAADEARRAKRKAAFDNLMTMTKSALESGAFSDADAVIVKQALFDLRPLRSSEPVARVTVQAMLKAFFGDSKVKSGADAYAAFRAGALSTPDVRKLLTLAIKTGKPEDRLWIEYNAKEDEYVLVATGAAAPLGWMGYTPSDAAVKE